MYIVSYQEGDIIKSFYVVSIEELQDKVKNLIGDYTWTYNEDEKECYGNYKGAFFKTDNIESRSDFENFVFKEIDNIMGKNFEDYAMFKSVDEAKYFLISTDSVLSMSINNIVKKIMMLEDEGVPNDKDSIGNF